MGSLHEKVFGDDDGAEGAKEAIERYYERVDPEVRSAKKYRDEALEETRRAEEAKFLVWSGLGQGGARRVGRGPTGVTGGTTFASEPAVYTKTFPGGEYKHTWTEGEGGPDVSGALAEYTGDWSAGDDYMLRLLESEVGPTAAKMISATRGKSWGPEMQSWAEQLIEYPDYEHRDKLYRQLINRIDPEGKVGLKGIMKKIGKKIEAGESADQIIWDELLPAMEKYKGGGGGFSTEERLGGIIREVKQKGEPTKYRLGTEEYAEAILGTPQGRMVDRLTMEAEQLLKGKGVLYDKLTQAMFGGVTDTLAASQRQLAEEIRHGMAAGGDARNQAIKMSTKIRAQENINRAAMQQLREGMTNLTVWARDNAKAQMAFNQMWVQGMPLSNSGYTATMSNLMNLQSTAILPAVAGVAGTGLQGEMNVAAYEAAQGNFWRDMVRGMVASGMQRGFAMGTGQMQ